MTINYEEWKFYQKNGTTLICSIDAYLSKFARKGLVTKTFSFVLYSDTDYANLESLCKYADRYYVDRNDLRGCVLFVERSPGQSNTIKIVDPSGKEIGFGILSGNTPIRDFETHPDIKLFEIELLWMGDTLPTEIADGIYQKFYGLLPSLTLLPSGTLYPSDK